MLEDFLIKKIDDQNRNLKNISKCFDAANSIIQNTEDKHILSDLKDILKDLKPVLMDLEHNLTELENALPIEDDVSITSMEEEIYNNNTLLISEIQNKVVLPYTYNDLQKILYENKEYKDLNDVINKVYTVPFDNYKNPITSRFNESFNLMRKREKASILESLSLALELSFNSALNPAIITACKNLDELDTYLDCLSENELHKFNLFNIKYEILPQIKIAYKV